MGDLQEDSACRGENQDKECEPISLIPEGFDLDDALPSISLEDFEGDNDVWLVDIPASVDPNKLLGQQLDFRQDTSFIIDDQSNERCVSLPSNEPCSVICLLSSHHENSQKIVALNPAGKININVSYDVPQLGTMIPESKSVQLPKGLKVRHPFLGPRYKDVLKSMELIKEIIVADEVGNSQSKHVEQHKKKTSVNEGVSTDLGPVEEGEIFNSTTVKNEVLSPKKSKKRKRESYHEEGNNQGVENVGVDPVHLLKKDKKEKKEETICQGTVEMEMQSEGIEVLHEEGDTIKKRKKDKRRASEIVNIGADVEPLKEEVEIIPETPEETPRKKKKKIKRELEYSIKEEEVTDVSMVDPSAPPDVGEETPKKSKKKKKRRESEYGGGAGQDGMGSEDVMMVEEMPSQMSERVKKIKKEVKRELGQTILEVSCEEGDAKQKKSKKRLTIDKEGIEAVNVDSQYSSLIAGRKGTVEMEMQSEGIEVLHEEGDTIKKKRKKDKRRASEIVNIGADVEPLKEEVEIIPETPEETPRKKKKKIKRELEYSIKEEEVTDVSMVDPSAPPDVGEETPKKSKKKKKRRESEYGGGAGQDGMGSEDVMMVEEMPSQTSRVADESKKDKWYFDRMPFIDDSYNNDRSPSVDKNSKQAYGEAVSCVQHKGESSGVNNIFNNDSKKGKRRHTLCNAGTSAVSIDTDIAHFPLGVKMEGKSQHKKRQSLMTQGFEAQLLSPKKEKKIKKESNG